MSAGCGRSSRRHVASFNSADCRAVIQRNAFDSEPDRILAFLTRRDTDSASDWIRVGQ